MASGKRVAIWSILLVIFIAITTGASVMSGAPSPRLLYLWLLFGLCTSPLIYAGSYNGKYIILIAILPLYFVYYGLADFLALFSGVATASTGVFDEIECAVLLGGVMLSAGYNVAACRNTSRQRAVLEWQETTTLLLGMIFWSIGIFSTWYWQIKLQKNAFTLQDVTAGIGMLITLGRMLQPLGMILIAYRFARRRSVWLMAVVVAMLCCEIVLGFAGDSKELAMRGLIIVLVAQFVVNGKVPKIWFITGAVVVIMMFPVFQAYRYQVLGIRHEARESAADHLWKNMQLAIHAVTHPDTLGSGTGPGFVGRVSLKGNVGATIERVGNGVKYQNGFTYELFFFGMVPRVFWPDKPDTSVGQLFNRELHISQFRDVYISPSYLGESYWNFGWAGVVVVMFMIGALLGYIGKRCDLTEGVSVTRFLVLALTLYGFGLRFEGGIALEALVWVRSLLVVFALHWLFARKASNVDVRSSDGEERDQLPFENLMH
ncbi:MAG TPA: hypothetical protein VG962_04225 [Steroidobacteraceae bacterium]|nr:hypothetical protein [Steroidobacteraceae bacterium]